MNTIDWGMVALFVGAVGAISFALAASGEPTALWLWRDVLKVL